MSNKRLIFYVIALIVLFAVLTVFLLKKFHFKPFWFDDHLKSMVTINGSFAKKIETDLSASPEPTPGIWLPGGRDDPFALLPEEEALKGLFSDEARDNVSHPVSGTVDSVIQSPVPTPVIPEPVFPKDIYVRGIIIGESPQAYIEENGEYQKIVAGDWIGGGKVLRITENGVMIQWNGKEIWLKPQLD